MVFVHVSAVTHSDVCVFVCVSAPQGLEPVVMSVFKQPTRTSLVSDGAECIMINKRFFQQNLTEDVANKIRKEVQYDDAV